MLIIQLNQAFNNAALPKLKRDFLLADDNDGVLFLADLSYDYCWPGTAPNNGDSVVNINESGVDGTVVEQSGNAILFAGGGFDYDGITKRNNCVSIPASIAAALDANQDFLVCLYAKLPQLADWNASANLAPFVQWCSGNTYLIAADLLTIGFRNTNSEISFRRQTAVGAADVLAVVPHSSDYGSVVQLAFWRNADGQGARIKSANGTVLSTAARGSDNSSDVSTLTGEFGVTNSGFMTATLTTQHAAAFNGHRQYRFFVENLAVSGRDPEAVLDADYARTIGRGVFS